MGLELIRSLTPSEFDDSSQGLPFWDKRSEQYSSSLAKVQARPFHQVIPHILHHMTSIWARNERTVGTQNYFLSIHESLVHNRFSRIELAFDLYL